MSLYLPNLAIAGDHSNADVARLFGPRPVLQPKCICHPVLDEDGSGDLQVDGDCPIDGTAAAVPWDGPAPY